MKQITIFILSATLLSGCKKNPFDTYRDEFTNEQLLWIQNSDNPKYRVITEKSKFLVISRDTVLVSTQTNKNVGQIKHVGAKSFGNLYYYEGFYELAFVNFFNFFLEATVKIDNQLEFNASMCNSKLDVNNMPDTALVAGVLHNNIYKCKYSWYQGMQYQMYFKKGIGFIYFEKDSLTGNGYVNYKAYLI